MRRQQHFLESKGPRYRSESLAGISNSVPNINTHLYFGFYSLALQLCSFYNGGLIDIAVKEFKQCMEILLTTIYTSSQHLIGLKCWHGLVGVTQAQQFGARYASLWKFCEDIQGVFDFLSEAKNNSTQSSSLHMFRLGYSITVHRPD